MRINKGGTKVQGKQQKKEDEAPTTDNDDFVELFKTFSMENENILTSETDIRRHDTRRGGLECETVIKTGQDIVYYGNKSTENSREIQDVILLKT